MNRNCPLMFLFGVISLVGLIGLVLLSFFFFPCLFHLHETSWSLPLYLSEKGEGEQEVGLPGLVIDELEIQTWKVCLQSGFLSCAGCFQKWSSQSRITRRAAQRFASVGAVEPKQSYLHLLLSRLEEGMSQLVCFLLRVSKTHVLL